jgi:hypothetical protein
LSANNDSMTELCIPTEPRKRYRRKTVEAVEQDGVEDGRGRGAKQVLVCVEAPCEERVVGIQMELDGEQVVGGG